MAPTEGSQPTVVPVVTRRTLVYRVAMLLLALVPVVGATVLFVLAVSGGHASEAIGVGILLFVGIWSTVTNVWLLRRLLRMRREHQDGG